MKDKCFLDTNIFIYTFDDSEKRKQKLATDLVYTTMRDQTALISTQVVQELLNAFTKKFAKLMPKKFCDEYMQKILAPLCAVFPSIDLYQQALDLHHQHEFSFYDSLIVAAALQEQCKILYTEDLHHGQRLGGLRIHNPFL